MNNNISKNTNPSQETLMEFPCEFPLKIMGNNKPEFIEMMCDLVTKHISHEISQAAIDQRQSSSGKYLSLTLTITAESKQQLDNIYQELYEHVDVKMTL